MSAAASSPALPIAHSGSFRTRRFLNWFPLGVAYALLYMGRYNLTVAKNSLGDLMTKEDFGTIFLVGTWVYGCSFLLNGPTTDRIGGRKAMLIALSGSLLANLAMGWFIRDMLLSEDPGQVDVRLYMSLLYGVNMYFQSFAAVAIVKVNASWFHIRERGGFSGIFGTMISSGIFLAYTVNGWILDAVKPTDGGLQPAWWVFFAPAGLLFLILLIELPLLRDAPSLAGHADFDVGDGDAARREDSPVSAWEITRRILTHPIIFTIALIEFCTGVLRQGVMQWIPVYAKEVWVLPSTHMLMNGQWSRLDLLLPVAAAAALFFFLASRSAGRMRASLAVSGALCFLAPFLQGGWGGLLFVAGVIGGNVAGYVSDLFFQSRRAPAAGGLYALLTLCTVGMIFSLGGTEPQVGWVKSPDGPLQVGDRIVSVEGKGGFTDWKGVSEAVACVPASCKTAKKVTSGNKPVWDSTNCTCSTRPAQDGEALPKSDGTLALTVLRGDREMGIEMKDPKAAMTAGDKRTLPAGPKLTLNPLLLGVLAFLMSLCVIGTHGLLSGTATMDFGGRRSAATAVGVIDGFVYLGSGLQAVALGYLTTRDWALWPMFLLPFAVVGTLLCRRIWHAAPGRGSGH